MRKPFLFLSLPLFFMACQQQASTEKVSAAIHYFDLKGYIAKEADRLNALQPSLNKTVMVNKSEESKKLKIADWHKELSAFTDADINKSAWQGLFLVTRTSNEDKYTSDNEKVPVKSLVIKHLNGKVRSIQILIGNSNILYTSKDTLSYYPDSLYQIKKTQHIKLLNEKSYRITGKF